MTDTPTTATQPSQNGGLADTGSFMLVGSKDHLTIRASHATTTIHTTTSHLFWSPSLSKWVPAAKLRKAKYSRPRTADGGAPRNHDGLMWDLTVPGNNDHDFYILPIQQGSQHTSYVEAVLVHNSDCGPADREIWQLTRDGSTAMKRGGPFNSTFYQSASDETWWTPDVTGHGGSAFKVYEETARGLQWIEDANQYGDYIDGKWKGDTGYFIPGHSCEVSDDD